MNESKMNYKDTLNLPETGFPMKANLSQREPEILKKWAEIDLYRQLQKAGHGRKKFILHDGPPYANGHIHLGHALNKTLKDIIVKSKILSGFDSPYIPGWDCHGLPIELSVEKKIGKPGHKVTPAEFRVACREYANTFIDIQRDAFKRLGAIGDWEHPYLTMDFNYEANIIRALGKILANGHMQKGYKPVYWCLDCCSALAEAEVEYADKTSHSIDVRFYVADEAAFLACFEDVKKGSGKISIPIWTTTPWTLPANQAVALNPLLQYVLVELDEREQVLLAEDLLSAVLARYGNASHRILGKVTGEKLDRLLLKHPFNDREIPVVLGDHVTVEGGTGAVHTAPAHGVEDYLVGKQYNLPMDNPVGDDGCYIKSTPIFAGLHVTKANEKIIELLETNGVLLKSAKVQHSYPHCWRHKTPLIFRATPQWFISMDKQGLRLNALEAIERVEWIPGWGKSRINSMMGEARPDWCVSRQRAWGVPISVFMHKETGELHPKTQELIEVVARKVEEQGIEAWYSLDTQELLGDEAAQYQKSNDVLDVWFDSGVTHECVLKTHSELTFPSDLVLEGSDQHRGWFQSSLLTSVAINGVEPYREVLTHGFIVDSNGHKMSKSLNNGIEPEEIIKTLGADVLRLWVASVDYRGEVAASKEIFTRTSEMYRRMRNTMRFFLANLHGFDPAKDLLGDEQMLELDRWAVDKTRRVQNEIMEAYDAYQFHIVVQKLHQFCVADMGGFYLDIIKDRQYTMAANSRGRRSAQTALYHIVNAFVRWMAPIMTFTAEEIWQYIPGVTTDSVLLTEWYHDLKPLNKSDGMNEEFWQKVHDVRDAVNKEIEAQRNAGKIGSALEAEVTLYCGSSVKPVLEALENELRFVLITSKARVLPDSSAPLDAVLTEVPGLSLQVQATTAQKCDRCWHRVGDVNANPAYPGLCGRCVENVAGTGEVREYA
jgi:isoleucyl-tRNA synthetase